jgi:hypothetical protein
LAGASGTIAVRVAAQVVENDVGESSVAERLRMATDFKEQTVAITPLA